MRSIITALVAVALAGAASATPTGTLDQSVTTEGGLVSGTGSSVRSFKGIPYANGPVGALRRRPPQPAETWNGVRDGSRFGPDCMQPAEYPELRGSGMSEDCLSVNVWTPARTTDQRLPVMVWIYGGGFTYGSGSHPSYDGEALARRGIVVVTLNYRVGLFGFMAHPQLTAESPDRSSGNYALMDQIAALEWVQRNIGAFGGDPKQVTVAGQSAGAMSISALMTSDRAQGLFHQAILPVKTADQFKNYLNSNFPGFESRAAEVYRVHADTEVLSVLSDLVSDTQFLYGTREMLRLAAPREPRIYRYVFTQRRNGADAAPIHGDELQYPFDNLAALHRGRVRPSNESDANVAREMAEAWARFVKTGNPNGGQLPDWPRYARAGEQYLEFGKDIQPGASGPAPRLDMIRDFYASQRGA